MRMKQSPACGQGSEERRTVETPLGPMEYRLTVKQVKNLNLRLRSDGTVAVSLPRRAPRSAADAFVRDRADWIVRHRQALQRDQGAVLPAPPDPAAALPVLAASLERMYPLVEPLGVPRPVLRARFMTSRWGSCHVAKGVVVLNTALAAAEEDLLDYVTLHELVHFLHPNHGPGFYAAMDALLPDWREKRRRLKGYELERA